MSNKMSKMSKKGGQTMKLYTEEQVRKAINDGSLYSYINGDFEFKNSEDDIINALTPIELPNEDEILYQSQGVFVNTIDMYEEGFIDGAEWIIEHIKNQAK